MSATTSTHHQQSGSIWNTLNLVIGSLVALFATFWGAVLLMGSLKQSFGSKEAPVVASSPAPEAPAPAPAPAAAPAASTAAPAQADAAFELTIKPAGAAGMEYDTKAFNVKAGQKVKITFENAHPIPQPHNIVFGKPGMKDKIMMAAMQMAASPDGMAKGYIPEGEDVLFHTKLIQPTQKEVLEFDAPKEAGLYPYLCTFPGHGMLMNGVMTVE
jgi:azurin